MTPEPASTRTARPRRAVLAATAVVLSLAAGITFGISAAPADARPMLEPCTYDNTCTTTTVRR